MNYADSYTAAFYAAIVDMETWTDSGELKIESGNVKRTGSSLRHSAQITVHDFPEDEEKYVRIYMDARQGGELDHDPVFTGIATSPEHDINGNITRYPLELYSVLKPLEDVKLDRGYYVPAGMTVGAAVRRLLQGIPAPYEIEDGSPMLTDYIIAEDGETKLSMIDNILDASGWIMTIDGWGKIHMHSKSNVPVATFSPLQDIVEMPIKVKHDWYKCPNVFKAASGDAVATERDDDPVSPLSTVSRKREVVAVEMNVTLPGDEDIAQYAKRRLKEEQEAAESADYPRKFIPNLNIGDVIQMNYEQIKGLYTVTSQNISLTINGRTQETVERALEFAAEEELITPVKHSKYLVMPNDLILVMPDGRALTMPYKTFVSN